MSSTKASPLTRSFITLFAIGGVIWFGASIARYVVAFDAFMPGTVEFKPSHTEETRIGIIWMFTLLGGWTGWSFVATVIGAVGIAVKTMHRWKSEGWMFICAVLFILLAPAQGWMIWQDYGMWKLFNVGTGSPLAAPTEIIAVFSRRITDVASSIVNGLTFLSAITIIVLMIWKPLRLAAPQPTSANESQNES